MAEALLTANTLGLMIQGPQGVRHTVDNALDERLRFLRGVITLTFLEGK